MNSKPALGPLSRCLLAMAAPLTCTLLMGCGSSLQSMHESHTRFEHCMALDAEGKAIAAIRRQCWHDWLHNYSYGQTRDRVVHARRRVADLDSRSSASVGDGRSPQHSPLPQDMQRAFGVR